MHKHFSVFRTSVATLVSKGRGALWAALLIVASTAMTGGAHAADRVMRVDCTLYAGPLQPTAFGMVVSSEFDPTEQDLADHIEQRLKARGVPVGADNKPYLIIGFESFGANPGLQSRVHPVEPNPDSSAPYRDHDAVSKPALGITVETGKRTEPNLKTTQTRFKAILRVVSGDQVLWAGEATTDLFSIDPEQIGFQMADVLVDDIGKTITGQTVKLKARAEPIQPASGPTH